MKHTPGPWRYSQRKTLGDRGAYVDRVEDPHIGRLDLICENARPNDACLIAAAPDLLNACKMALLEADPCGETIVRLREAIAKAEGK